MMCRIEKGNVKKLVNFRRKNIYNLVLNCNLVTTCEEVLKIDWTKAHGYGNNN